jgi:hypothetical protein
VSAISGAITFTEVVDGIDATSPTDDNSARDI